MYLYVAGLKLVRSIQVGQSAYVSRVTFLVIAGNWIKLKESILSNIAVTNNTGDCSIREY